MPWVLGGRGTCIYVLAEALLEKMEKALAHLTQRSADTYDAPIAAVGL